MKLVLFETPLFTRLLGKEIPMEQGRARPNAQAAALILMVRKFPDTLDKLSALGNEAA